LELDKKYEYLNKYKASISVKRIVSEKSYSICKENNINKKCQTLMAGFGMGGNKP